MKYQEFTPTGRLSAYVQCIYLFESDQLTGVDDIVFPGGSMEVIFNLGSGVWKTASQGLYRPTPVIELWGQLTKPLPIRSEGKNQMLGVRFYTHAITSFFREEIWELNDQVCNAIDFFGKSIYHLHERLLDTPLLTHRIDLVEQYLLSRLRQSKGPGIKTNLVGQIIRELQSDVLCEDIQSIASRYALSPRYLQTLFLRYTGVTPKVYHKLNRFQRSLKLVTRHEVSLTSIAYECGYFDQSHFIREFRSFTGLTPSDFLAESFPVSVALSNG
ncbi:helix-turn-helix transcriptional regulator [Spirosoma aureum]|uniref:Helix-turn-helix transcriptional regulator n=1 Tax=Spirosoma aureum TaxID=2692134 RepID=A0A6G9AW44_9BACT|nr:helix-turn-helix transcriptional regulator [Spirosoma aureum]QIP16515.1 helix-turn-helix transcriptional regulator [Spirosoma aureum]